MPAPSPAAPLSELVPFPHCPLCGRGFYGLTVDPGARGDFSCRAKGCPQHWWAMRLDAGAVLPQLAAAVGTELAPIIMGTYQLPVRLERPMYWQLTLTRNQVYHRSEARSAGRTPDVVPLLPRLARPA